jgi:predicted metalloendopeptidase
MPSINYEKEWLRLITNLERSEARLLKELDLSTAEDERADAATKLERVRAQLAQAHADLAAYYERQRAKHS